MAARLAGAATRVLLLEAGGDCKADPAGRLPDDYDVPAFHPFASENPAISWNFFVNHYADAEARGRDPKCGPSGVLYPRAGTLGGCTAHNAMIFLRPHACDWNDLAALTGDRSWRAARMERFFRRVEACRHRPGWRLLSRLGLDPTGHGWRGWLATEKALPMQAMDDDDLLWLVRQRLRRACGAPSPLAGPRSAVQGRADPNDRRFVGRGRALLHPLSTHWSHPLGASGSASCLAVTVRTPCGRLEIELHAWPPASSSTRTIARLGVDTLKGESGSTAPTPSPIRAGRER